MSDYLNEYNVFRDTCDFPGEACRFFRQHNEDYGLASAKSCASIGAGDGLVDTVLLKECMPRVSIYYGVEPDSSSIRQLKNKMAALPMVKKIFHEGPAESWDGPAEKVDVILLFGVVYYMDKPARLAFFQQCMDSWLNTGGYLVVQAATTRAIGARLRAQFTPSVPNIETVRDEIEGLGFRLHAESTFCVRSSGPLNATNGVLLSFLLCRDVDREEMQLLAEFLDDIPPEEQQQHHCGVVCIRRE